IPIARITGQYLEYVQHNLDRLDTEVAGEFLLMAATLIHIKSRMLLPPDPDASPDEEDDPRAELVQQLLEHEKFKKAAQMLQQKHVVQSAMFSASALDAFRDPEAEPELAVSLYDLVRVFQQVLDRAKEKPQLAIAEEKVSVAQMMEFLCRLLAARAAPLSLAEVLENLRSREAIVATFLALLELVRLQAVVVRQQESFGEIVLHKHSKFDAVLQDLQRGVEEDYR
ncbi:MAG: segregation/condensation protein A, partial [Acidobacteria bacterium]|nr:segregation/condensation protein A [Acidobacteriota bacterium]